MDFKPTKSLLRGHKLLKSPVFGIQSTCIPHFYHIEYVSTQKLFFWVLNPFLADRIYVNIIDDEFPMLTSSVSKSGLVCRVPQEIHGLMITCPMKLAFLFGKSANPLLWTACFFLVQWVHYCSKWEFDHQITVCPAKNGNLSFEPITNWVQLRGFFCFVIEKNMFTGFNRHYFLILLNL